MLIVNRSRRRSRQPFSTSSYGRETRRSLRLCKSRHAPGSERIGAGVPTRPVSSASWHRRAEGWAARTGLRRRRPEKRASDRSVRKAERAPPDSRSAASATTPRTGRYHARFFRPGPRRGLHPSPVEVISHSGHVVPSRPAAVHLHLSHSLAQPLSQNGCDFVSLKGSGSRTRGKSSFSVAWRFFL